MDSIQWNEMYRKLVRMKGREKQTAVIKLVSIPVGCNSRKIDETVRKKLKHNEKEREEKTRGQVMALQRLVIKAGMLEKIESFYIITSTS